MAHVFRGKKAGGVLKKLGVDIYGRSSAPVCIRPLRLVMTSTSGEVCSFSNRELDNLHCLLSSFVSVVTVSK